MVLQVFMFSDIKEGEALIKKHHKNCETTHGHWAKNDFIEKKVLLVYFSEEKIDPIFF